MFYILLPRNAKLIMTKPFTMKKKKSNVVDYNLLPIAVKTIKKNEKVRQRKCGQCFPVLLYDITKNRRKAFCTILLMQKMLHIKFTGNFIYFFLLRIVPYLLFDLFTTSDRNHGS